MSLYAWLMLLSFIGPFALSFDKKVSFYKLWPGLFLGIFLNGLLFILWDSWFTNTGVWSFNSIYTFSPRLLELPLEEWAFFIVVPFASVFIYACLRTYFKLGIFNEISGILNIIFMIICAAWIISYPQKTYTLVNATIALLILAIQHFYLKKEWMKWFWFGYFVHLIPFFIINGILTGAVTDEPVVFYNPTEIIGFRLITIPIEDSIYALSCLLIPISIMEWWNEKNSTSLNKLKKSHNIKNFI
jgi:lycopene cyclase domain-containing protein